MGGCSPDFSPLIHAQICILPHCELLLLRPVHHLLELGARRIVGEHQHLPYGRHVAGCSSKKVKLLSFFSGFQSESVSVEMSSDEAVWTKLVEVEAAVKSKDPLRVVESLGADELELELRPGLGLEYLQ